MLDKAFYGNNIFMTFHYLHVWPIYMQHQLVQFCLTVLEAFSVKSKSKSSSSVIVSLHCALHEQTYYKTNPDFQPIHQNYATESKPPLHLILDMLFLHSVFRNCSVTTVDIIYAGFKQPQHQNSPCSRNSGTR